MMTNDEFLEVIRTSFANYLEVGTSRSTAKLKNLHGEIALDLEKVFKGEYTIHSLGYKNNKEESVDGRYYQKNVDIVVKKEEKTVAGYAVKFVVRNYSQNSNNYFENMLGETANIRSNDTPYFQIFIIFDKVPYYKSGGEFKKYDKISTHNLNKYLILSQDNHSLTFHTPDKTLIVLVKLKEKSPDYKFKNIQDYTTYYKSVINDSDLLSYEIQFCDPFWDSVIFNDYEDFIQRSYHISLGKLKK